MQLKVLKVRHRADEALHGLADGAVEPKKRKAETPKDRTHQTHLILVKFLEENVVEKEFESEEALQQTLDTWPAFAQEHGLEVEGLSAKLTVHHNKIKVAGMEACYTFCAVIETASTGAQAAVTQNA